MKKTLLASTAILALSAIGFTNTAHATEELTKGVTVNPDDVNASLALTNPGDTSVLFNFKDIKFESEQPNGTLAPVTFSVTYDIQNRTFANIDEGRFTIAVSTSGDGLDANLVGDSNISETNRGTRNTDEVSIQATLDPTKFNVGQYDNENEGYKITVSLNEIPQVTPED